MATQTQSTSTTSPADPSSAFKFHVELEGLIVGMFKECNGLSLSRETKPLREGGVNDRVHYLPESSTQGKITLKRGITLSRDLWDWYCKGLYDNLVERINMSIILYNAKGEVLKRWNFTGAFPTKWEGPTFNSANAEVAVETLELAHDGFTLA